MIFHLSQHHFLYYFEMPLLSYICSMGEIFCFIFLIAVTFIYLIYFLRVSVIVDVKICYFQVYIIMIVAVVRHYQVIPQKVQYLSDTHILAIT